MAKDNLNNPPVQLEIIMFWQNKIDMKFTNNIAAFTSILEKECQVRKIIG